SLLNHAMRNYLNVEAARKNLHISLQIDPATATYINADGSRVTQHLWNLLQNACKLTPESGSITIRVFNEPSRNSHPDLVISIADTGIGVEPELLPIFFDSFEQGERSRTRVFGGLGLGLAISRAIVE